jgi:SWI/SNF-related matrix-associated actin-dependent regulator 1 of chromatin subfamily A
LEGWVHELAKIKWGCIILDEVQYISEPTAIRTRAVKEILKHHTGSKIFLSGTPIRSKTQQFHTALHFMAPSIFPDRWKFLNRYCDPKFTRFGWTFDGVSNLDELRTFIKPFFIRRKKKDVLPQLPAKQRVVVPLTIDPKDEAKLKARKDQFLTWLKDETASVKEAKQTFQDLRREAYLVKRDAAFAWIEEQVQSVGKIVVGAWHTAVIQDLEKKFKGRCVVVDGSVTGQLRQDAVDRFQTDPSIQVFIGQTIAAGVGITLTASPMVAVLELIGTPGDLEQLEDRVHRIGQEADSVFAYYLLAPGSIEEDAMETLQRGFTNVSAILDGGEGAEFFAETDLDTLLIKRIRKAKRENNKG